MCTPAEVVMMIKARGKSVEGFYEVLAWHAAWMLNCWTSGDKVTPDQLLGRSSKVDLMALAESPRAFAEFLNEGIEGDDDGGV